MPNNSPAIPRLALTGGIGSGKSAAAHFFELLGIPIIDSDAISHEITAPGGAAIEPIRQAFGAAAITPEGAMDRAVMRERVFNHAPALALLESITHPLIHDLSRQRAEQAQQSNPPYLLFMIPLLFESDRWQGRFEKIIVVDCPEPTQIERVSKRNQFEQSLIQKMIDAQVKRETRLQHADLIISNEGTLDELEKQVLLTHQEILKMLR
jgi:dephospho-CoA kinase